VGDPVEGGVRPALLLWARLVTGLARLLGTGIRIAIPAFRLE
jgi:hypothetical protein